jgi:hypothetical protein
MHISGRGGGRIMKKKLKKVKKKKRKYLCDKLNPHKTNTHTLSLGMRFGILEPPPHTTMPRNKLHCVSLSK